MTSRRGAKAPPGHDRPPTWNQRRERIGEAMATTERALTGVEGLELRVQETSRHLSHCLSELDRFGAGIDRASSHAAAISEHYEESTATLVASAAGPAVGPSPGDLTGPWTSASVHLDQGMSFEVVVNPDLGDPVSAELARGGTSNQPLVTLMLELVGPGDRILDIGAHVGTFSLAAAARGALPLALDASPENVALLRASAILNGFDGMLAVHAAAGDAPGAVDFLASGPWGQVIANFPGTVKVPAVTVAELVDELAWHPVTFAKIDVEGSELKTLRGMGPLLVGPDAPALLYESNAYTLAQQGLRPADLVDHLEGLGYASYLVDRPRLVLTRPDEVQPHTIVDYLAVKRFPMALAATGWEVLPGMEPQDWVGRVAAECRHPDACNRGYALEALARADAELAAEPVLRAAVAALLDDPDEGVRAAAGALAASAGEAAATSEAKDDAP
jgi:FkbM family methyltransferase